MAKNGHFWPLLGGKSFLAKGLGFFGQKLAKNGQRAESSAKCKCLSPTILRGEFLWADATNAQLFIFLKVDARRAVLRRRCVQGRYAVKNSFGPG